MRVLRWTEMRSLKQILIFISIIFLWINFDIIAQTISVSVNPSRVKTGETVKINIEVNNNLNSDEAVSAILLEPLTGTIPLKLKQKNNSIYSAEFQIKNEFSSGLYAVHVWLGDSTNPSAIGKGTFLYNKIIGDFCYPRIFDSETTQQDLENYFNEFKSFGGNFIIAHGLITPQKAYYSSEIAKTEKGIDSYKDILEILLKHTDKEGVAVIFSTSWDMTNDIPYEKRTESTKKIMEELYQLYGHHPSMIGFYPYQEGSGTYFQPFVKEFCGYAKSLNPGLLTAVAPYMDDPLLAGYLSTVDDLDIIIYQSMVMASYRPDNRKKFPFRRVKDFGSVSVGAKQLQNKISLTHVELFGYGENRLKELYITKYDNIYQQILSAATVAENDGITLFTYSNIIYDLLKKHPEFEQSKQAVFDGIKAFQLIGEASEESNQLSVYFPWADWTIERWANNYYDALDAFRVLGIPVNVLPYAPPFEEAHLPYYPYHENPDVLERLLKENKVLIFPNISGFYQTDSDMIKHFIERGGVVIAFGPQIPMGTSYDRSLIFGGEAELETKVHTKIISKQTMGERVSEGDHWEIGKFKIPIWKPSGAKVIAAFEDGTPAVLLNKYGEGTAITILTDAFTAAKKFPDLIRDIINSAIQYAGVERSVDILGTNANTDIAVTKTDSGFKTAIINHNSTALDITLKPLKDNIAEDSNIWIDLFSNKEIKNLTDDESLKIHVPPKNFRIIEMQRE